MKKPRLLRDIITIGVIVIFYLFIRGNRGLHDNSIIVPPGIKVLLFLAMVVILCYQIGASLKKAILRGQTNRCEHISTTEAAHPWIDSQSLSHWTSDLEALGFVRIDDFTGRLLSGEQPKTKSFIRLMVHPVEKCIAISDQMLSTTGQRILFGEGIVSCFEGGWEVSTNRTKPHWLIYIMNMPGDVWTTHLCNSPKELFRIHLEQCSYFSGLENTMCSTAEEYITWENESLDLLLKVIKLKSPMVLCKRLIMFLAFHPKKGGSAYAKMRK